MTVTTTSTVRRGITVLAAGAALAVAGAAAPALAGTTHPSGREYIVVGGAEQHPVVILHGAITAAGRDDPHHHNYDLLTFGKGSLRIVHPQSQAKFVPHVNKKTCFVSFTETGRFHLSHGKGRFAGISGSGHYTARGTAVVPRTKSGSCNLDVQPKFEIFTVHARGTIK